MNNLVNQFKSICVLEFNQLSQGHLQALQAQDANLEPVSW